MPYDHIAILTDLDGTLFNSEGKVSADDRAAIREFIDGGGLFGVSTGREPNNALRFLADVPINGPSIVLNGAAVYDFGQRRYLYSALMDKEAAFDVLDYCRQHGLPLDMQVYTMDGIFYANPLETADPAFLRIHQPAAFLSLDVLKNMSWFKAVLLEREPNALAFLQEFLARKGYTDRIAIVEGTTDVVKVGKYRELLPPGVNKGTAVSALRRLPAYAGRRIFAVGDYWNDMELLQAVEIPCAPENAIDEVKQVCKYVLASHNDSAIADLIRRILPSHCPE